MNKFEYKNLTPFKWFVLENFPFIEADFDALTEWQLFCKLGKEMNKILNSENTLGTQVESVTNAFIELQNYVNNYFENLDIQEEINEKLNQMAQDGTLANIISQYINLQSILAYNTVNDMKNAENLVNGSFVKTYSYNLNDNQGAFYKVRNIENTDVVNDYSIIALNDNTLIAELVVTNKLFIVENIEELKTLKNIRENCFVKTSGFYNKETGGSALYKIKKHTNEVINNYSIFEISNTDLIAELIIEDYINVKQFGAYGDNIHDDTNAFKNCIDFAKNTIVGYKPLTDGININIPNGTYIISDTLKIDVDGVSVIGESYSSSIINAIGFDGIIFDFSKDDLSALFRNSLKNLTILSRVLENEQPIHVYTYKLYHGTLENLRLYGYYNGIEIWTGGKTFLNNIILGTYQGGDYTNIGITLDGSDLHLNDIQIQPDLNNYLYALECKNIDGAYINNMHTNGLCRITAVNKDGTGGSANEITFNNCHFDTSSKDCFNINGWQDQSIRNIKFNNCYFLNNLEKSAVVFNTAFITGVINFSNCAFKNCLRGILGNSKTVLNINDCDFINNQYEDIVLKSNNNIITSCRFTGTKTISANSISLMSGIINNIISLCNLTEITTSASKITSIGNNTILNNIE